MKSLNKTLQSLPLILFLATFLIFSLVNIDAVSAQEDFNIFFKTTDSVSVDATRISWSTSKEAVCEVEYSKNINTSPGLTEEGVFTPLPNSVNEGRYHYVSILKDLDRNKTYYFDINCSSKYGNGVSASSDTLSFLSSVGFFDRPDLAVTDISFTPMPTKGKLYNGLLNVEIQNIGNKVAESPNGIFVKVSAVNGNTGGTHPLICDSCDERTSVAVLSTGNFAIGETRTVSFKLTNTPFNFNTFNVRASVDRSATDGSGVVTEIDELNNLYTKDFKIDVASVVPSTPVTFPNTPPEKPEIQPIKEEATQHEDNDDIQQESIKNDENSQQEIILSNETATRKLTEKKEAGEVNYDTLISVDYVEEEKEYEFIVNKEGRFLFFVPKIVQSIITIDAETGEIKNIRKPWWSFLVNE